MEKRMCEAVLKRSSLLYVEDEEPIRELLKDTLAEDFALFDTAGSAKEALQKLSEREYDIVVSDIEMPGMDGLELAEQIMKMKKDTEVLLLSAYSEKEYLFRAIDVGIRKYLVKPFAPQKLLEVICEILREHFAVVELGGGALYDPATKSIKIGDQIHRLTKKEHQLLDLLIGHEGEIVTMEQIKERLWPKGGYSEEALRALVRRVRGKSSKDVIKNIPGIGYRVTLAKREKRE
jgi:DNA-binding response OmpR family regulator